MARTLRRRITLRQAAGALLSSAPQLLLAVFAFVVAVQVSVAGEFRGRLPQIALKVAPSDAEARARLASALVSGRPTAAARVAARNLALDAIRRDAIAQAAVRPLALALEGDRPSAEAQDRTVQLMTWAESLSRRDQATQLWFAERQIREGDIRAAMQHFDVALRTSTSGRDTIIPLLATAASDPLVADTLVARLREKPDWAEAFEAYLLNDQVPPATAAYIAGKVLDREVPAELEIVQGLVQRLASADEFDRALQLYSQFALGSGSAPSGITDGGFEGTREVAPFAWSLTQAPELWSAREARPDGEGNVLRVMAISGKSGDAARQLLRLQPGSYRLSAEFGDVPRPTYERPVLSLRCANGTAQDSLASIRPEPATGRGTIKRARFSVPASCRFQWLSISVFSRDRPDADPAWIDNVAIGREG